MPSESPSPKLANTVDPDVYQGIVEAARDDGVSVSAWITGAVRRALRARRGLREAVAEWEAEHGPLSTDEMAQAHERIRRDTPVRPSA